MKKVKMNLICLLGIAFLMQSCVDDLNVTPEDSLTSTSEEFFSQPNAYKTALAGIYGNLALTGTTGAGSSNIDGIDAGTSQYGRCLWYMQVMSTDEVIWSYENDPGTREIQRNIWTAANPILRGMYGRAMFQVALVNDYLRQTTPEKLSERGLTDATQLSEIETYRNEAKALRALAYYHLMDLFGKAAFVTENDALGFSGPEYNRLQLFEFIESELLEIIPNLKAPRSNEYGRLDQAFARMILAKIYLNAQVYIGQERYSDCAIQCNEIISSGFTLEPNYLDNFKADNDTSSEIIFGIQSDGILTQNYGPTTVMVNGSVGSLEQNGESLGVGAGGWGGALRLRKQFVQKFDGSAFDNDDRNTIISGTRDIEINDIANRDQGYVLTKFSNKSSSGINGLNSTFVDTDFPLFRLADAYLMYAECAVRGASNSTLSQAVTYVNALRERANGGSSLNNISSGDLNLDFILDERARELYWECHRRQDLIRFDKFTGGAYNWAWKGNGLNGISLPVHLKVYPLPTASIAANQNLTQNPGY